MKKGCLVVRMYGVIVPSHVGIIISQCKDPYQPTRISWKVRVFFFGGSLGNHRCEASTEISLLSQVNLTLIVPDVAVAKVKNRENGTMLLMEDILLTT